MYKTSLAKFQIGKNGVTQGTLDSLSNALKSHKQVRISMLKSSGRDRESIRKTAAELESKLPYNISTRIIGFTIILIKISLKSKKPGKK